MGLIVFQTKFFVKDHGLNSKQEKNLFAQNGLATASTLEFFPSPPSFNLFGLTIILITAVAGLDAGPGHPLVLYSSVLHICNEGVLSYAALALNSLSIGASCSRCYHAA